MLNVEKEEEEKSALFCISQTRINGEIGSKNVSA